MTAPAPAVYHFNRALVRKPAKSVINGLRDVDGGNPTYAGILAEHDAYVQALRAAKVGVSILPAWEEFPDSVFVEDPALVFSTGAILLRPGAPSRLGETQGLTASLQANFETVLTLPKGGFVEGGDVLVTPKAVLIGLSARTDQKGAQGLTQRLEKLGQEGKIVETPKDVLHFKTDCSLLDEDTILTTSRLARAGVFEGFNTLITPEGEEAAANALRVNEHVFIGADFPKTIALLEQAGYAIVPLNTAQIGKIDAGLSCMSLRWNSLPGKAL